MVKNSIAGYRVLPEQIEERRLKESLQYEVIMTMEEGMGVHGGCAM